MIEEDLHRGGVHGRQHQRDVLPCGGADRGEDVGPEVAELLHARRALATAPPAVADPALVADPSLVGEPQLDPLVGMTRRGRWLPGRRAPLFEGRLRLDVPAWGGRAAPSGAKSRADAAPGSCSTDGRSCRTRPPASGRGRPASRRSRPSASGSGPRSIAAARAASSCASSRRCGRPSAGREARSTPRRCRRTTASRSACRSMPASRAASARLSPSSACAIAYIRAAARPSFSRRASRRSASADSSSPILSALPMPPPASGEDRESRRAACA